MSATVSLPHDVAAYLERLRGALADLPPEERDELLADVEASVLEAAADSAEPLEQRLGPPQRFARELRAAAGLDAPAPQPHQPFERLRSLAARGVPPARELAPIWWVARGYVAVAALNLVSGDEWSGLHPAVPRLLDGAVGAEVSLLAVAAVVALSIRLGLRARRSSPRAARAINGVLALACLPVALHLADPGDTPPSPPVPEPMVMARELTYRGEPVTNVYPYSRDGHLLLDVLLYDQFGRPLKVGSADPAVDPLRRRLTTARGTYLLNAFPIRYLEPGGARVRKPQAGPPVKVPRIVTPPLRGDSPRSRQGRRAAP